MTQLSQKPEVTDSQPRLMKISAYEAFIESEGVPNVTGFAVNDLRTVEVKPWARLECLGAYINLDGNGGTNDAYVAEIPPGGKMAPEKHLFEKNIYVLQGRGATLVGDDPNSRSSFEWKEGSIFSVPLNVWHQHLNGSGAEPARFLAVTTAPITMNLFHNTDFIFNNGFVFEDRIGDPRKFQGEGSMYTGNTGRVNVWETNFIPDIETFTTFSWKERGAGGSSVMFEFADNTQAAHVSQFPWARTRRRTATAPALTSSSSPASATACCGLAAGTCPRTLSASTGNPARWSSHRRTGSTSTSTAARHRRGTSRSDGARRSTASASA